MGKKVFTVIAILLIALLTWIASRGVYFKQQAAEESQEATLKELQKKNTLQVEQTDELRQLKNLWKSMMALVRDCEASKTQGFCDIDGIHEKRNRFWDDFRIFFGEDIAAFSDDLPVSRLIAQDVLSVEEAEGIVSVIRLIQMALEGQHPGACMVCRMIVTPTLFDNLERYKLTALKERLSLLEHMQEDRLVDGREYQDLLLQIADDAYITAIMDQLRVSDHFYSRPEENYLDFSFCIEGRDEDIFLPPKEMRLPVFDFDSAKDAVNESCLAEVMDDLKNRLQGDEIEEETKVKLEIALNKIAVLQKKKDHFQEFIMLLNE